MKRGFTMKNKKILTLCLTFLLLCSSLFATPSIPIYANNKLVDSTSTPAYISANQKTMIPVRAVGEVLGLQVDWQSPEVILSGKHQVTNQTLTVRINSRSQNLWLNGSLLTNCIEIKEGRSYITLRVLAESFGYIVDWKNKSVYISNPIINVPSIPPTTDQPETSEPTTPPTTDDNTPEVDKPVLPPSTNEPDDNTPETTPPATNTQTSFENQVLTLVNQERAAAGLSALSMDEDLRKVARIKSTDMRTNNYFSHASPTYGSPFDMMKQFGISYRAAAENIAQGYTTPEAVVKGWMNSSGHRANILNSNFTHIGIGYDSNGHYWTQMFIKK